MCSSHRRSISFVLLAFVLICICHSSPVSNDEHRDEDASDAHGHASLEHLKQMLQRRNLYDPAFGDSWSNYLEKKRSLFDPAYAEWADSFKRTAE